MSGLLSVESYIKEHDDDDDDGFNDDVLHWSHLFVF